MNTLIGIFTGLVLIAVAIYSALRWHRTSEGENEN